MNGVTILEEFYEKMNILWVLFLIVLMIIVLFLLWSFMIAMYRDEKASGRRPGMTRPVLTVLVTIIGIFAMANGLYQALGPGELQYRIQIDETASFLEFENQYTIIKRVSDDEFIVKERE